MTEGAGTEYELFLHDDASRLMNMDNLWVGLGSLDCETCYVDHMWVVGYDFVGYLLNLMTI